eukprot:m.114177 g.114177  ORF g.114177 m.114177 type:complete len:1182 (+) comp9275_c0_seq1:200-3745(+)
MFRSCSSSSATKVRDEHEQSPTSKPPRSRSLKKWSLRRKKTKIENIFGVPLSEVPCDEHWIPLCLKDMLAYIENHGTEVEGVFRRAAMSTVIKELKNKYEKHPDLLLEEHFPSFSPNDVIQVAQLVKQFLRDIPGHLVSVKVMDSLYEIFKKSQETHLNNVGGEGSKLTVGNTPFTDDDFTQFRKHLNTLPPRKLEVLKYVIHFCARFARHHKSTKMGVSNIATVLAPNIFEPNPVALTDLTSSMKEVEISSNLTQFFMKYNQSLFRPAMKVSTTSKSFLDHVANEEVDDDVRVSNSFLLHANVAVESEEAARMFEASGHQKGEEDENATTTSDDDEGSDDDNDENHHEGDEDDEDDYDDEFKNMSAQIKQALIVKKPPTIVIEMDAHTIQESQHEDQVKSSDEEKVVEVVSKEGTSGKKSKTSSNRSSKTKDDDKIIDDMGGEYIEVDGLEENDKRHVNNILRIPNSVSELPDSDTAALITTGTNPHVELSRTPTTPLGQQLSIIGMSLTSPYTPDNNPVPRNRRKSWMERGRRGSDCLSEMGDFLLKGGVLKSPPNQRAFRDSKARASHTVSRVLFHTGFASALLKSLSSPDNNAAKEEGDEHVAQPPIDLSIPLDTKTKPLVQEEVAIEAKSVRAVQVVQDKSIVQSGKNSVSSKPSNPKSKDHSLETSRNSNNTSSSMVHESKINTNGITEDINIQIVHHRKKYLVSSTKVNLDGILDDLVPIGDNVEVENRNYIFLCCKTLSKRIKVFERAFQEEEGRKPTSGDRGPVSREVKEYKRLKKWIKAYDSRKEESVGDTNDVIVLQATIDGEELMPSPLPPSMMNSINDEQSVGKESSVADKKDGEGDDDDKMDKDDNHKRNCGPKRVVDDDGDDDDVAAKEDTKEKSKQEKDDHHASKVSKIPDPMDIIRAHKAWQVEHGVVDSQFTSLKLAKMEKVALKSALVVYDKHIFEYYKRKVQKEDKLILRSLYARYKNLKAHITKESENNDTEVAGNNTTDNAEEGRSMEKRKKKTKKTKEEVTVVDEKEERKKICGKVGVDVVKEEETATSMGSVSIGKRKQIRVGNQNKSNHPMTPPEIPPRPNINKSLVVESPSTPSSLSEVVREYKKLKKEKSILQKELFEFQTAFFKQHGHNPKTKLERAPKRKKHARYKALKDQLKELQEEHPEILEHASLHKTM